MRNRLLPWGGAGVSMCECVCLSVCLSAPEREGWESEMEKAVGPWSRTARGCPPGALAGLGRSGQPCLPRLRVGWGWVGWKEKESEEERLCGWERM